MGEVGMGAGVRTDRKSMSVILCARNREDHKQGSEAT